MGRVCLQVFTMGLQQFQKGSMVMRQQYHNCHSSIYDRCSNLQVSMNDHADVQLSICICRCLAQDSCAVCL